MPIGIGMGWGGVGVFCLFISRLHPCRQSLSARCLFHVICCLPSLLECVLAWKFLDITVSAFRSPPGQAPKRLTFGALFRNRGFFGFVFDSDHWMHFGSAVGNFLCPKAGWATKGAPGGPTPKMKFPFGIDFGVFLLRIVCFCWVLFLSIVFW